MRLLLPVGLWPAAPGSAATAAPGAVPRGLVVGLAGLAAGLAAGAFVSPAMRDGLGLVGVALGWQAALGVLVLVPVCRGIRRLAGSLVAPAEGEPAPHAAAPEPAGAPSGAEHGLPRDGTEAAPAAGHDPVAEGRGAADDPAADSHGCPPGPPSDHALGDGPSIGRRLRAAAAAALGREGGLGGDLFLATAIHLVAWRWWVGLWG